MKTLYKSALVVALSAAVTPAFANDTANKIAELEKKLQNQIDTNSLVDQGLKDSTAKINANKQKIQEIEAQQAEIGAGLDELGKAFDSTVDIVNAHSDAINVNAAAISANVERINEQTDRIQEIDTDVRANQAGVAQHANTLAAHDTRIGVIEAASGIDGAKFAKDVDARINQLDESYSARHNKLDKKLSSGIASAIALSALPTPSAPNQHHLSFGTGYFNKQSAVALGATGTSQTGKVSYKVGLSYSKEGGTAGGVGGSYRWK